MYAPMPFWEFQLEQQQIKRIKKEKIFRTKTRRTQRKYVAIGNMTTLEREIGSENVPVLIKR